jgi:sporulation protein YlmC with PRC-barrel domain
MKTLLAAVTVISFAGLLFIPGVFAQMGATPETSPTPSQPPASTPSASPSTGTTPDKAVFTSDLIGAEVRNTQGESLGRLSELVLDRQEARITTAVVSVGGVLGIGAKSVAIPWKEVMLENNGKTIVVSMSKDEINNAPEWKKPEQTPPSAVRTPAEPMGTPRPPAR